MTKYKKLDVIDIRQMFRDMDLKYHEKNLGDVWYPCPVHGEDPHTAHPDAHISVRPGDKFYGRWKCFGCGAKGNYLSIVKHKKRLTSIGEARQYAAKFKTGAAPVAYIGESEPKDLEPKLPTYFTAPASRDAWNLSLLRYIEGRGVTWEQIRRFHIGYVDAGRLHDRIIAPVYLGKEFRNYIARSIDPDAPTKVLTMRRGRAGLFGSQFSHPAMPAIVTEGWLDALAIDRIGYVNAYSTNTNRVSEEQMKFLSKFPYVIVVRDNDDGGNCLVDSMAPYHDNYDIRVAPVEKYFGRYKDADEVINNGQAEQLIGAIRNSSAWAPARETFNVAIDLGA